MRATRGRPLFPETPQIPTHQCDWHLVDPDLMVLDCSRARSKTRQRQHACHTVQLYCGILPRSYKPTLNDQFYDSQSSTPLVQSDPSSAERTHK